MSLVAQNFQGVTYSTDRIEMRSIDPCCGRFLERGEGGNLLLLLLYLKNTQKFHKIIKISKMRPATDAVVDILHPLEHSSATIPLLETFRANSLNLTHLSIFFLHNHSREVR